MLEASYPEGAHDATGREYSPRCFPGTRQQYIEDIIRWGVPALGNISLPLYWMKGPAGVGKSAVAQTCAEELKKLKRLGAAFFFSIKGQNQPEKFFPSIAYQLSTIHPPYRDLIDRKLRHDKTLVNKMMRSQFSSLIEEPLRELASQRKGIGKRIAIIVDGLDECEGVDAQREIIHIIAEAASDKTLPLCWAFFSRPEPHIEATFSGPTIAPHCHKVILPISRKADGEIELYLKNGFENILQRHNLSMQSLWPSAEDMKILVDGASGSFIYATTVLRYVGQLGSLVPRERLRAIIDTILDRRKCEPRAGTSTDAPFAQLDAFYILILQRISPEILPSVHLLLALICRRGTVGAILAANILGMSKDKFEAVCHHTSAVVHFWEPGKDLELDPTIDTSCMYTQVDQDVQAKLDQQVEDKLRGRVFFYHKSFDDFLLDPARSGPYCAKGSEALANHYAKTHLEYDRSYSWQGSGTFAPIHLFIPNFLLFMSAELVLASGVTDSGSTLSYPYTNELVNSFIKAKVYIEFGDEDTGSFSALGVFGALGANCDFHKNLHVSTHLRQGPQYPG